MFRNTLLRLINEQNKRKNITRKNITPKKIGLNTDPISDMVNNEIKLNSKKIILNPTPISMLINNKIKRNSTSKKSSKESISTINKQNINLHLSYDNFSKDSTMTFYMNPDSIFHVDATPPIVNSSFVKGLNNRHRSTTRSDKNTRLRSRSKSREPPLPDLMKELHSKLSDISTTHKWALFPKNIDELYISQKNAFSESNENILNYIKDYNFCRIKEFSKFKIYMNTCDFVGIINDIRGNINGFVVFNIVNKNKIDIKAICSNPNDLLSGAFIINNLETFCEELGLISINVQAIEETIQFYHNMGFNCDYYGICSKNIGDNENNNNNRKRNKNSVKLEAVNLKFFTNPKYVKTKKGSAVYSLIDELLNETNQGELFPKNLLDLPKYKKESFENNTKLIKYINENDFCSGVNPVYVQNSIDKSNITLVLYGIDEHIHGFAACDITPKDMYISTICTNPEDYGAGLILVNSIKNICKVIDIKTITLNSVESAKNFYEKLRFVCDSDRKCIMNVNSPPNFDPNYNINADFEVVL
jgi:hypothetical protein